MFSEQRRFIAGAVCPRCEMADRMVVFHRDGRDHRECVACGFSEFWSGATVPTPPATRPQRAIQQEQAPLEAVRLIDPAAPAE